MAKKLGRPRKRKGTHRNIPIRVMVTAAEKARFDHAAEASGTNLSEWIRQSAFKAEKQSNVTETA